MDSLIKGVVQRIASNGAGVVSCHGENYFVHGTVRGETVLCQKIDGEKYKAALVEILESSSERVEPRCPYYGVCGGCSLRHIGYEAQLREKTEILKGAFLQLGGIAELPAIAVFPSPSDGYRDRAQFHRKNAENGKPAGRSRILSPVPGGGAGFMCRDSRTVVHIEDCLVLNETLRSALKQGALVPPLDKDRWTVYGRAGKLISEGGAAQDMFIFSAGGRDVQLYIDAAVFFQGNGIMLERLADRLLAISSGSYAGDFYAGCGTFSLFLHEMFEHIDVLEENRAAISLARRNLGAVNVCHQHEKFRFYAEKDSSWVKKYGLKHKSYDFLCIDPGRQGLSPLMLRWICEKQPKTLAYISCEITSLARDARALIASGLRLESLDLFDFYPQTPRLETLAVFRQASYNAV